MEGGEWVARWTHEAQNSRKDGSVPPSVVDRSIGKDCRLLNDSKLIVCHASSHVWAFSVLKQDLALEDVSCVTCSCGSQKSRFSIIWSEAEFCFLCSAKFRT